MRDLVGLIWSTMVGLLRSKAAVVAENVILRHQINVLRRTAPKRPWFSSIDRLIFVGLHRLFPGVAVALAIIKPDTVIRWHRSGFRAYWRWKSRSRGGRPKVALEVRQLIREMSLANPIWGAPRIHGELLKLGIDIGQTSVAKYMARRRRPPSQGWRTFLRNHADGIAAMDLFVVPTISFRLLFGLLILRHDRRHILWAGVTAHPTAEWIARQLSEACGWEQAPQYLIRDRDRVYGAVVTAAPSDARHQRSTNIAALSLAKRLCRTAHRLGPSRVRRPCRRAWRTAPSPPAAVVQDLLQRHAHTPVPGQGCTIAARSPGDWPHSLLADLGRAASSLWPDMIRDRHSPMERMPTPVTRDSSRDSMQTRQEDSGKYSRILVRS